MYEQILQQMREQIRQNNYAMTLHAEEEMNEDELTIFDVEHIILTGEITERQRDTYTAELKYRIQGKSMSNILSEVIAKISPTNKLIIITIYITLWRKK